MAPATTKSSMSEHAESSTTVGIFRNDDPLSQALRDGTALELDDIVRLDGTIPPRHDAISSDGTLSTAVISSHKESTITKPTSITTTHHANPHSGRGTRKCRTSYASSLSGTHGSASEAENARKALRRDDLFAMGDWANAELEPSRPLKGTARAKERQHSRQKSRAKKHTIIIEQNNCAYERFKEGEGPIITSSPSNGRTGKEYLRHRFPKYDEDAVRLAEEGHTRARTCQSTRPKPLSRTRTHVLAALIVLMVLTVALSAYGARHTGKARIPFTKGIVFGASALLACMTVLAMVVARRALSEALLAGLLEFVFGFALLVELDDFM